MRLLRKIIWASMSKKERQILLSQIEPVKRSEVRRVISGSSVSFPKAFDKYEYIFIHIPKNAGTSINNTLQLDKNVGHQPLSWYETLDQGKCKNYFKFCFVRNPWDRLVSSYFYLKNKNSLSNHSSMLQNFVSKFESFDDFVVQWVNQENIYLEKTFFPQQYFMRDSMGMISMDYIGRFESLDKDLIKIMATLNITNERKLSHLNQSPRKNYQDYYTAKSRKIVQATYTEDIDLFGYKF